MRKIALNKNQHFTITTNLIQEQLKIADYQKIAARDSDL